MPRKTKQVKDLESQLMAALEKCATLSQDNDRLISGAHELERQLGTARDEIHLAKATIRVIVLGCKFEEVAARPRNVYGKTY